MMLPDITQEPMAVFTLEQLMECYEALEMELEPTRDLQAAVKAEIQQRVKAGGQTVYHGRVVAQYRNGYRAVKWDSKALDGYAAAHPEILPFRTESESAPTVAIKVQYK